MDWQFVGFSLKGESGAVDKDTRVGSRDVGYLKAVCQLHGCLDATLAIHLQSHGTWLFSRRRVTRLASGSHSDTAIRRAALLP